VDGNAFDDLVRSAQRGASRRGVLRAAVGTLATAGFGLLGWNMVNEVAAKKKHKSKKKKQKCQKFCYGVCVGAGGVCCTSPADGVGGGCPSSYPHCCAATGPTGGGCCEAGYPLCCADPVLGEYCCPAGSVCCSTATSGCCFGTAQDQGAASHGASRGHRHMGN
jgi:hypothetical protein